MTISDPFAFRRLPDGRIEVRSLTRDGFTDQRVRYSPEQWAALVAELRVEVTPCPA